MDGRIFSKVSMAVTCSPIILYLQDSITHNVALRMNLPETLIERLQSRQLIPFVGAGVPRSVLSAATGKPLFPNWTELLDRAASRLEQESRDGYAMVVRGLLKLDKPEFLDAARRAKEGLGPVWFKFLKDQIDCLKNDATDDSLELARRVWSLGSNLVVTTNYDRVLHWASNDSDTRAWNISSPVEQAAILRDGIAHRTVWHLHGTIDDASNIILTPDGYDRLYSEEASNLLYKAGLETFRALLASRSFLFIGFSFTDTAVGTEIKYVSELFSQSPGPHYALVHKDQQDLVRSLSGSCIQLIPFDEYGSPLLEMLDCLGKYLGELPHAASDKTIDHNSTPELVANVAVPDVRDPVEIKVHIVRGTDFDDTCDTPPAISTWVGRTSELRLLNDPNVKVIAVTGMGGQGKSTLIAKYLQENANSYSVWDWRDCKEQGNNLRTHLTHIIERLTKGDLRASHLTSESTDSVIRLFFNIVVSVRGIFVFDNIDKYVNATEQRTVDDMDTFVQIALKSATPSRFVLTARPRLKYDSAFFSQIELPGLTIENAGALFVARDLSVDFKELQDLHDLTQGHPLWINLIANQVSKGKVTLRDLIGRIKAGKDGDLPTRMLDEVWSMLHRRETKLMRYLAELVYPETASQIADYTNGELSANHVNSTIARLRAVDLVVVKSPNAALDTFELHPLVREYVRRRFTRPERDSYISKIFARVDAVLKAVAPGLSRTASMRTLDQWSAKVSLQINRGDSDAALDAITDAHDTLLTAGFSERYVQLATEVLSICDWDAARVSETKNFESTCADLVETLAQLGRFSEAESYLKRFEQHTSGATARYIQVCRLWSYIYWSKEDFDDAKEWGLRGVEAKSSSHIDTHHDCRHQLALAQRDSGETEPALKVFLMGTKLEDAADPKTINRDKDGPYYGNIGRTLYFAGEYEKARVCLLKSAWILERRDNDEVWINLGWAAMWLGELLEKQEDYSSAFVCFRRAMHKWSRVSPKRAETATRAADRLVARVEDSLRQADDMRIDRRYLEWLNANCKFSTGSK